MNVLVYIMDTFKLFIGGGLKTTLNVGENGWTFKQNMNNSLFKMAELQFSPCSLSLYVDCVGYVITSKPYVVPYSCKTKPFVIEP